MGRDGLEHRRHADAAFTAALIWVSGKDDVWAMTGAQAAHWDGATWTERDPGFTVNLADVQEYSASGGYQGNQIVPARVEFVSGKEGTVCVEVYGGEIGCYEGGSWTREGGVGVYFAESNYDRVTAFGVVTPADVWTAIFDSEGDVEPETRAYSINAGAAWLSQGRQFTGMVSGISGVSPTNVWVTLNRGAIPPLLHSNGQQIDSPEPEIPDATSSVWDDGCGHVWATSLEHTGYEDFTSTLEQRSDTGWKSAQPEITRSCLGACLTVGGARGAEPWVVGAGGYVAHRSHGAWHEISAGITTDLGGPWTLATNNLWASFADYSGRVLFWDGFQAHVYWLPGVVQGAVYGDSLITGSESTSDVWALVFPGPAQDPPILDHYDGRAWSTVDTPNGSHLGSIWTNSAGELWAINGATSTLWQWKRGRWTQVFSPGAGVQLHELTGRGPTDLWLTGTLPPNKSQVFHFDGTSWSSTPVDLPAIDSIVPSANGQLWITSGGRLLVLKP